MSARLDESIDSVCFFNFSSDGHQLCALLRACTAMQLVRLLVSSPYALTIVDPARVTDNFLVVVLAQNTVLVQVELVTDAETATQST